MKKKDLIAQISKNLVTDKPAPPSVPVEAPAATEVETPKVAPKRRSTAAATSVAPAAAPAGPTPGTGKQAAFWLDDEDRALFHEMGMLLYSQGIKPSHNLVLRAAIRMVPRDHQLVEQVKKLIENDGRKLRHQKGNGK